MPRPSRPVPNSLTERCRIAETIRSITASSPITKPDIFVRMPAATIMPSNSHWPPRCGSSSSRTIWRKASVARNTARLSLLTEPLTNRNCGTNATSAAANRATRGRSANTREPITKVSKTVPRPMSSDRPRARCRASASPLKGNVSAVLC